MNNMVISLRFIKVEQIFFYHMFLGSGLGMAFFVRVRFSLENASYWRVRARSSPLRKM